MNHRIPLPRSLGMATLLAGSVLLGGCLDGVPTTVTPETSQDPVAQYSGPPPATEDVAAFKSNVWDNLVADNRCGACHGAGGQEPLFVHQEDVNVAYGEAIGITDLASPADSLMVTKVAGGHNCWLDSDAACGEILTAYIEGWAAGGTTGGGLEKGIELEPPPIRDPGAAKSFPDDSSLFGATVHPLLMAYCDGCHTESSLTPQAPYFADADVDVAYEAVRSTRKIDLDTPAHSRLVVRLYPEFHNCWSDCQQDAGEMEAAITAFAEEIPLSEVDPEWVTSKALRLPDGVIASGGSRYEANVIALYEFKTGSGNTIYDISGIEPALNLTLTGTEGVDFEWVGGWGVEFVSARAQGVTSASRKLHDFIRSTGEYSIEAWVVPANVSQEGPARIVSYSAGLDARNFTLGQTLYNYNFLHRSSTTDGNGEPALSTADDKELLQATQQHVVITFDPVNGRRIYVNGEFSGDLDPVAGGSLADWDDTFAFVLGDEAGGSRPWQGKLRLVAIHNRALTADQVLQNFEAGVGEKFFLLFSVGEALGVDDAYVMFEVSQFDSYAYLFNRPTFIRLEGSEPLGQVRIAGVRVGINGKESVVGQAWTNLDLTVDGDAATGEGILLSRLGSVIPVEKGPEADEFFLTFEVLGSRSYDWQEPAPPVPGPPADLEPLSDIGLRTFEEILHSMSVMTDVSVTHSDVQATFEMVKQQLPTVENIEGFLSSHQTAVSQLAIEFCNALVEDSSLRASYFPGFDFSADTATAFDTAAERNLVIDPLLVRINGTGLTVQPDPADIRAELESLMDRLTACGNQCAADRTPTVVKATCAAALGSAVMLIQ